MITEDLEKLKGFIDAVNAQIDEFDFDLKFYEAQKELLKRDAKKRAAFTIKIEENRKYKIGWVNFGRGLRSWYMVKEKEGNSTKTEL